MKRTCLCLLLMLLACAFAAARAETATVLVYMAGASIQSEACEDIYEMALADLISPEELSADYIIPYAFDPRVGPAVAKAVAQAARDSGVARI